MLLKEMINKYPKQYIAVAYVKKGVDNLIQTATVIKVYPVGYFNRTVEVKLNRITPCLTEIAFLDENMAITFRALYAGKKSKIIYQLWKRDITKENLYEYLNGKKNVPDASEKTYSLEGS